MAKLRGPLQSTLASGVIADVLQVSIKPTGVFLTRKHTPRTTYTRSQLNLRTYVYMLARFWHDWVEVIEPTWATHPNRDFLSPHHCFLFENHRRRLWQLWPIAAWNVTPTGSPPIVGGAIINGGAQCIVARTTIATQSPARFYAQFVLPYPTGGAKPLNVQAWDYERQTGFRQIITRHVPAGTWSYQYFAIDAWGRLSNPKGAAGITVTP